MRIGRMKGLFASVIVCLVALLVLSGIPGLSAAYTPAKGETRATGLDLIVGGQDEMKTRNLLPSIANDVWTSDVIFRVYDSMIQGHPTEDRPLAWIAKGVAFAEDGTFEATEYDTFAERPSATSNLTIVIYYDFNGVRWHDGTQMTPWDLFFAHHVNAQNSGFNTDMRVLFPNPAGYEAGGRQLNVELFDVDTVTPGLQRIWQGEGTMFGGQNNPLRIAVKFTLTSSFALFYESTIAPVIMPMHIWSRTGGGRHAVDFGCAVWIPQAEATARGISECGNANSATHGDRDGQQALRLRRCRGLGAEQRRRHWSRSVHIRPVGSRHRGLGRPLRRLLYRGRRGYGGRLRRATRVRPQAAHDRGHPVQGVQDDATGRVRLAGGRGRLLSLERRRGVRAGPREDSTDRGRVERGARLLLLGIQHT